MMKNNQKSDLTNTSVSHDTHKCLSRQAQVSDTTDTCVYQMPLSATRICTRCGRQLPTDDFYIRDRRHTSDSYCKECRKASNRLRRKSKAHPPVLKEDTPGYIVITRVEQRETRLELIMHALQIVHERIARQREKTHEEEFKKEWDEPLSFPENH